MGRKLRMDKTSMVSKHINALALGKRNYKKSDACMDVLEKEFTPGETVTIESGKLKGRTFRFVDKFANKTRINVGMNARRFEFEEITTA